MIRFDDSILYKSRKEVFYSVNKIQQKRLIMILAGVCAVFLIAMCVILAVSSREPEPLPFSPPEFDSAAVDGVPSVPDELGWNEIYKDGMSFRSSVCGVIRISDNRAKIYFTNYEENTLWLKIRVLDSKGNVLGETGLIKPGQYLPEITFNKLPKNGEKIMMRLMSYVPETYHSGGAVSLSTVAILEGK